VREAGRTEILAGRGYAGSFGILRPSIYFKEKIMYEINIEKNIRELLKNTIFAHPDDVAAMVKASMMKTSKKKKK
jgi:hypothetical protein